jgi:CDP-diacylglycerol--serine O-phosphatidyltransferase
MVPLFVSFEWGDWIARSPYLNAVWISGVALLMVSTVPTVSLKQIRIPHHLVMPSLLGIGVLAAFFMTAPWPTLTVIGIVYTGSIPLTMRAYSRLKTAAIAEVPTEPAELPAPAAAAAENAPPPIPLDDGPAANEWRH